VEPLNIAQAGGKEDEHRFAVAHPVQRHLELALRDVPASVMEPRLRFGPMLPTGMPSRALISV
jgi:hypothetical protein